MESAQLEMFHSLVFSPWFISGGQPVAFSKPVIHLSSKSVQQEVFVFLARFAWICFGGLGGDTLA